MYPHCNICCPMEKSTCHSQQKPNLPPHLLFLCLLYTTHLYFDLPAQSCPFLSPLNHPHRDALLLQHLLLYTRQSITADKTEYRYKGFFAWFHHLVYHCSDMFFCVSSIKKTRPQQKSRFVHQYILIGYNSSFTTIHRCLRS